MRRCIAGARQRTLSKIGRAARLLPWMPSNQAIAESYTYARPIASTWAIDPSSYRQQLACIDASRHLQPSFAYHKHAPALDAREPPVIQADDIIGAFIRLPANAHSNKHQATHSALVDLMTCETGNNPSSSE